MAFETLVINPGSTSTKVAVYGGQDQLFQDEISHSVSELKQYDTIIDQFNYRLEAILSCLETHHYPLENLAAVVGRGGLLRPIESGTYLVTEALKNDLRVGVSGQHASNLGGLIADDIAKRQGLSAYIVDPVVVDELQDTARYSGSKDFERKSIFHALNHKAVGRIAAKGLRKEYQDANFVIAHLGGGVSVGAHALGKVIDVNNALDGEGPFSPERSGNLPLWEFTRKMQEVPPSEVYSQIVGKGGLVSYLGTNDLREVERMMNEGNEVASQVFEAMAYQIAKEIGAYATVLKGQVDGIVLTGGLARSPLFIEKIQQYIDWIAPIIVVPGEDEMGALNEGAQRVLNGTEEAKHY